MLSNIISSILRAEEAKGNVVRISTPFPQVPSNDLGHLNLSQLKELRMYCDMCIEAKEPKHYMHKRLWKMAIKRVKP